MSERRKKYFIDTNIIMYSAGKEHKFKEACLKILRDMGNYENE
jgi:predicted nucleic acid-binding protein